MTADTAPELTYRQRKLYIFIHHYIAVNGYSPSLKEMQDGLDMPYTTVHGALQKMERLGLITREPRKQRTIKIVGSREVTK